MSITLLKKILTKKSCLYNILGKRTKRGLLCIRAIMHSTTTVIHWRNYSGQLMEMLTEGWWKTIFLFVCIQIPWHCSMKVFVTKYNFTGFVPDQNSYNGLTLRRDQIGNPRRLDQITLCFRVKLEYLLLITCETTGDPPTHVATSWRHLWPLP